MSAKIRALRYHDISVGHRVVGQGGKCESLHGHNYRVTFHVGSRNLDSVGMVLDFGIIKSVLCEWLEEEWDHKFLVWEEDPFLNKLLEVDENSIVVVPFNPTAENMAQYLLEYISPILLKNLPGSPMATKIEIEETRKCSVTAEL